MIYKAAELRITKTRLEIGVPEPFKLLHVTDTHLIYADETDSANHRELMARRREAYDSKHGDNCCRRWGDAVLDYARKEGALVVHTGDLIDFVSHANLVEAKKMLDSLDDYFFIAGNHEFSQYVGTWPDEPGFREANEARVQSIFKDDIFCFAREYKGVNLVGIDTKNYQFSQAQLDFLNAQIAKGIPMLLFYHEPFYAPELRRYMVDVLDEPHHLTIGEPPHERAPRHADYRIEQSSLDFIETVKNCMLIKGAFSGHFHFNYEHRLPSGSYQYLTAGSFLGMAREIEIV